MSLLEDARLVARAATGRPLVEEKTDATWSKPGTQTVGGHRRAGRWSHLPYRQRAGVAWSAVVALVLGVVGSVVDLWSTVTTLRLLFWTLVVFALWAMVERSHRYSTYREFELPWSKALGERLGYRNGFPVDRISVPSGHLADPDRRSTARLPEGFSADATARKRLVKLSAERLGLGSAYDGDVEMAGAEPVLWVASAPGPPGLVRFTDVRDIAEQAPAERPFVGLTSRRVPVHVDWTLDSPHALASMGSGAGKSVLGRALIAHTVRHGGRAIVIDSVKHGASHRWAKGLPGVDIHRQPGTAHEALIALAAEVEQRCEQGWHDAERSAEQRVLLVIEESNATRRQLQSYWANELEGKKTSPAVGAIADILCVGREAEVNSLAVGQLMTAQASGGNDARENYGVKIMSRFSRNAARMLVPEIDPQPRSSRHLGRAQVCIGGTATETQIVFMTESEAREWALGGVAQPVSRASWAVSPDAVFPAQEVEPAPVRHLELVTSDEDERPADEAADDPVGLREAVATEIVDCTLAALRQARHDDPEFPAARTVRGQEHLYAPSELVRWARNRQRGAS